ncbi:hypothetical protein ADUPG1_008463 [Aduncisulcus paluster]|uniref:Uncharacterized protein n=1 Tax=Aduncisulcus paluster TaxID=2918883 RepID=A0ABQ5KS29_9EUKA|nr:hypothetical protein ADUPG1_008463 [Aduncisulcus paluster]
MLILYSGTDSSIESFVTGIDSLDFISSSSDFSSALSDTFIDINIDINDLSYEVTTDFQFEQSECITNRYLRKQIVKASKYDNLDFSSHSYILSPITTGVNDNILSLSNFEKEIDTTITIRKSSSSLGSSSLIISESDTVFPVTTDGTKACPSTSINCFTDGYYCVIYSQSKLISIFISPSASDNSFSLPDEFLDSTDSAGDESVVANPDYYTCAGIDQVDISLSSLRIIDVNSVCGLYESTYQYGIDNVDLSVRRTLVILFPILASISLLILIADCVLIGHIWSTGWECCLNGTFGRTGNEVLPIDSLEADIDHGSDQDHPSESVQEVFVQVHGGVEGVKVDIDSSSSNNDDEQGSGIELEDLQTPSNIPDLHQAKEDTDPTSASHDLSGA